MLQIIVVCVAVILAVAYAVWQLMPQSWRRGVLTALLAHLKRPWQAPLVRRLQAANSASGGCGSCGSGGCSLAAGKPGAKGNAVAPGDAGNVVGADNVKPLVFHPPKRKA